MTDRMLLVCVLVFALTLTALVVIDPAAQFQQHNFFRSRVTYAPAGHSSK